MNVRVIGLAVATAIAAAGCGPNLTATPTSPTTAPDQPFVTQVGGFYNGTLTLANVRGGECAGDVYRASLGSVDVGTVVINQTRTDVTAVVRSASTGLSCTYKGSAGLGAFALSTQACEVNEILVLCPNGASRVLEQVGSTVTAELRGGVATGRVATFYNVFAESTEDEQKKPVAGLVIEEQFDAIRR